MPQELLRENRFPTLPQREAPESIPVKAKLNKGFSGFGALPTAQPPEFTSHAPQCIFCCCC